MKDSVLLIFKINVSFICFFQQVILERLINILNRNSEQKYTFFPAPASTRWNMQLASPITFLFYIALDF